MLTHVVTHRFRSKLERPPHRKEQEKVPLRSLKCFMLIGILVEVVLTACDPRAYADLFVGSTASNSVLRYSEVTGDFLDEFVTSRSGGLNGPRGLILAHDGNLYVSSFNTNSVMRYDGTTGASLPAPGQTDAFFVPSGSGGLQGPAGLIFGPDGNLYVNSQTNNSVRRYSGTTGEVLDVFVPAGSGGLNHPRALVFGPDGNLYVDSSMGPNGVMRYDGSTGAPLPAPGQTGAFFASGLDPAGLVFGPDGNLYVGIQPPGNSVVRLNGTTGEFMDTFVSSGSGGLSMPSGQIFGPDGNFYISSGGTNSVLRYDGTTGAFIDAFIRTGSGGLSASGYLFFTNTDPTTLAYVPPPVAQFLITAPATAVSGTPVDVTVTALDGSGNIDTSYQGTITFTTTDADSGVVLPADYTFTTGVGGDNGVHTFSAQVTLVTLGDQTLTATDTVSGITGSVTITVGPGP